MASSQFPCGGARFPGRGEGESSEVVPGLGVGEHPERVCLHAAATSSHRHPPPPRRFATAEAAGALKRKWEGDPKLKSQLHPLPPQRPEQMGPSLGSPHVVGTPRWHLRGEGERQRRREMGNSGAPEVTLKKRVFSGNPEGNTSFPLAPNLDVPTSARLRTCRGFAMLLCKPGVERLDASPAPPRTPRPRSPPTSDGALSPPSPTPPPS